MKKIIIIIILFLLIPFTVFTIMDLKDNDIYLDDGFFTTEVESSYIDLNYNTLNDVFTTNLFDTEQLIINGDFSNGTTGWFAVNATNTMSNGNIINSGYGTDISSRLWQLFSFDNTQTYYSNVKFRIVNKQSNQVMLRGDVELYQIITSPNISEWYNFKIIIENATDVSFTIRHYYDSFEINNGSQLEVEYAYLFNISKLKANKQYSPLYQTTFDLMTDEEIKLQMDEFIEKPYLFIDYASLGIELSTSEMDFWYDYYLNGYNNITLGDTVAGYTNLQNFIAQDTGPLYKLRINDATIADEEVYQDDKYKIIQNEDNILITTEDDEYFMTVYEDHTYMSFISLDNLELIFEGYNPIGTTPGLIPAKAQPFLLIIPLFLIVGFIFLVLKEE